MLRLSLFSELEVHPEAETLKDYYLAMRAAVNEVRDKYPDADSDPSFQKAAAIIERVVDLCQDIESVPAVEAYEINTKRSKLLKQLGSDGMIDVTDKPSRLLAIHYRKLMIALHEKKYWPSEKCPSTLGYSVLTVYTKKYYERTDETIKRINDYKHRIENFDKAYQLQPKK
ncbi:MAG TPA: hypothetical protein VL360_02775 [Gammaproteobacteria bacterium]|jgi:hypothetical protein|nr:hypothetical protein [Gammaproteobacteria bacterium]